MILCPEGKHMLLPACSIWHDMQIRYHAEQSKCSVGGRALNHPPNSAKKSQQFGRTICWAYFSAKCFPVTRIMALAPQTHCPFGCCVVRDMWKPLLAEFFFSSCCLYKTKNGICGAKMIG